MIHRDTVELLKECNAGVKMGVDSIDSVLESVHDKNLYNTLNSNKEEHQKIGSEIHSLLNKYGEEGKSPNIMAKGMAKIKTNVILSVKESDHAAADLITDGCNMGVKSLCRYLNKYTAADEVSKDITKKLISLEHSLASDVQKYL